jgi:hypothetical protein
MSDVTAISQEYEANADLANKLNHFVLSARKHALLGSEPLSKDDRAELAMLVKTIRDRLVHSSDSAVARIPEEIVSRLASSKQGSLGYFLNDLETAVGELTEERELSSRALDALDCIVDAADASASEMFRRLRRR